MRVWLKDLRQWGWLVISNWRQYAEAGLTALVWAIAEKVRARPLSWHVLEAAGIAFLIFAFFNVWRAERTEVNLHRETAKNKDREIAELRRNANSTPDWIGLADRFKELAKSGIQAEHTRWSVPHKEWWEIPGINSQRCTSLCEFAGAMLLASPNTSEVLSERAKNCDNVSRWLYFLMENRRVAQYQIHLEEHLDDGATNIILKQEIRDLPLRSEEACLQCAAWQLRPATTPQ